MSRWSLYLSFVLLASCVSTTPAPETTASAEPSVRSSRLNWPVAGEAEPFRPLPSQICSTDITPPDMSRVPYTVIDVEIAPQARPVSFIPWALHGGEDGEAFLEHQAYAPPSAEPIRCRLAIMPLNWHEGGTTLPNAVHIGLAHSTGDGGWSFEAMCNGARFWVNGREVAAEVFAPNSPRHCVYRLPDPPGPS